MKTGWVTKKLGDVTTKIGSGATPLGGEEAYKTKGISLIRSLNVYDDGFRKAKLAHIDDEQADGLSNVVVEPHDVLLNITGASVARCCLAPADSLPARVNQHVSIIRPIKGKLDSAFLHYLLISKRYKDRLLHTGEEGGSTRQAITKAQLQEFVVEYPESLSGQQRIVGILDEAFDGLATATANAEQNLRNARALFESHLQSVFTQRGQGWMASPLSALCYEDKVITYGVVQLGAEVSDGVPCLRTSNVRWLQIETEGMKRIAPALSASYSRTILQGGEVLVNVRGTLGGVGVASSEMRGWNVSREVAVAPIDPRKMNPRFAAYCIGSDVSQEWLGGMKKGAAYVGINIEDLRNLPVHAPSLMEQEKIVGHLDALTVETQRLESIYQQKLAALDELKQSLLHRAFSGQLTRDNGELTKDNARNGELIGDNGQ